MSSIGSTYSESKPKIGFTLLLLLLPSTLLVCSQRVLTTLPNGFALEMISLRRLGVWKVLRRDTVRTELLAPGGYCPPAK